MDKGTLYLALCGIILAARICGELAARMGMPAVLGEMLAGVILGPSVLGLVEPNEIIGFLAELGIMLFIFGIGLESELGKLASAGRAAAQVAVAGVVLPMACIYPAMLYFGATPPTALFAAGTMAATSIGVTMRVLGDLGHGKSPAGRIVLGAAVLDDIIGIVLLALLLDLAGGNGAEWGSVGRILGVVAAVMCITPLFAAHLTQGLQFLRQRRRVPGLLPAVHIAALLFFAWASWRLGVPEILGAFAAGLLLSQEKSFALGGRILVEHEFVELLQDRIRPVMQLLTPIFFVNVGLSMDLTAVPWHEAGVWGMLLAVLALAVVGKVLAGFAATGLVFRERLLVGMAMVPRAEVGLVFAELGRGSGLFDPQTHAIMIAVVIGTTLLPPLALKFIVQPRAGLAPSVTEKGLA